MALPQPLTLWYPHSFAVVETECERSSATTYFWYREALDISNSISESGGLNWKMTLCLLVAWSLVGLAMIKGIQSSGKVGSSNPSSRLVLVFHDVQMKPISRCARSFRERISG